jgi:hypothetical protein
VSGDTQSPSKAIYVSVDHTHRETGSVATPTLIDFVGHEFPLPSRLIGRS